MQLTIAYMTNRRVCMVEWFVDSLQREISEFGKGLQIRTVMVDFFARERTPNHWFDFHVPPKPTVWQGPHRLTQRDYFAPSNARNTALCLAPDGWLLVVDDLSVLIPGYLKAVRQAIQEGYGACGAYKKVASLYVSKGRTVHYEERPSGVDSRWPIGRDDMAVGIGGGQVFGCSLCLPVESLLQINGWDEDCDSMGSEDYIAGMMLERTGLSLRYDRRMLTLESEELHHTEKPFLRIIKPGSPDRSWVILNKVRSGEKTKASCYYPEGLREVRRKVLAGELFPFYGNPSLDWFDNQALSEM